MCYTLSPPAAGPSDIPIVISLSATPPPATPASVAPAPRILNPPRLNIPEVMMPMHCAPCDRSAKAWAIAKNTLALAPTIKGKIKAQKRKRAPSVEEEYDSELKKSSARPTPPAPPVLYSAPPIPAGIQSFQWNSSGIHRNPQEFRWNSTGIRLESSRLRLKYCT